MAELPSGTITFLFTDIEGSTRLIQELPDQYEALFAAHDDLIRRELSEHGGTEVRTEGDSFFVVFTSATDAVRAAVASQQAVDAHDWPNGHPIRVRMGLHTGQGTVGGNDFVGLDVHRAARITEVGHGGQILLSEVTRALTGTRRTDAGHHQTLEAAISWGYELLSDAERLLYNRLCAFRGDFSLEAAEEVAPPVNDRNNVTTRARPPDRHIWTMRQPIAGDSGSA